MEEQVSEAVAVCPETLAGTRVEMNADGDGDFYCTRCGASEAIVRHSAELVYEDWHAGGRGYRKPLPSEITKHFPDA